MTLSDAERALVVRAVDAMLPNSEALVDLVVGLVTDLRKSDDRKLGLDASGVPTAGCPMCGEQWLKVPMIFDNDTYDVAGWGLEGECYSCGTRVTVCTPVDKEERI
jgi:hypothetical protein